MRGNKSMLYVRKQKKTKRKEKPTQIQSLLLKFKYFSYKVSNINFEVLQSVKENQHQLKKKLQNWQDKKTQNNKSLQKIQERPPFKLISPI